VTYSDVDVSPSLSTRYYVWEGAGEVWCNLGATGPPPPPPPPPPPGGGGDPVAIFTATPTSGIAPLLVTFDGSASYDAGGSIASRQWSFGDGGAARGPVVRHTYRTEGNFTASLTVTDNNGNTDGSTQVIRVIKPNVPPVANFSYTPGALIYPSPVDFDAGSSRDPDGKIVQYNWNFGDHGRASGRNVRHAFASWGEFTVRLTVQDDRGAEATRTHRVPIRRLLQPLNIRCESFKDESLFQTRIVNNLSWDRNPGNDDLGVQIVLHRVWRKKSGEADLAYKLIAELAGDTYTFMDKGVDAESTYVYTVTLRDNHGHESPITGGAAVSPGFVQPNQDFQPFLRRTKVGGS
jgi:chitodextrinase